MKTKKVKGCSSIVIRTTEEEKKLFKDRAREKGLNLSINARMLLHKDAKVLVIKK